MKNINFYLGERKFVEWDIVPTGNSSAVVIADATWMLTDPTGVEESDGTCAVNKNRVSALIEPKQLGLYVLTISVSIPPEVFIEEVQVSVLKNREIMR